MGCMVLKAVIKISSCRASDIGRRGDPTARDYDFV